MNAWLSTHFGRDIAKKSSLPTHCQMLFLVFLCGGLKTGLFRKHSSAKSGQIYLKVMSVQIKTGHGYLFIIEAIDSKYNENRIGPRIPRANRYLSEELRSRSLQRSLYLPYGLTNGEWCLTHWSRRDKRIQGRLSKTAVRSSSTSTAGFPTTTERGISFITFKSADSVLSGSRLEYI